MHTPSLPEPSRKGHDPDSFAERLKEKHGEGVDPEISLDKAPETSAPTDELVQRLKEHSLEQSRYQLQGEIARGGMGAILRVWDGDLRRHLAMKVILGRGEPASEGGTPAVEPHQLARFLEEAQVTGQLDHPGIVPVHELGLDSDGRVYFTMKLVKGRDLKTVFDLVFVEQEGWNETRALSVILKACEAMAYAHKKGVIHRDLKPANVMVGNFGEVYVMDWGLARVLGRKDTHDIRLAPEAAHEPSLVATDRHADREDPAGSPIVTMDGDVMGTPAYMAPEQARGELENIGPRSDVYSMGAMLYHLLARRAAYFTPQMRADNYSVLKMVLAGPPAPLSRLRPDLPPELTAICEKAMARDASQRYPDTLALAEDLRAFLEHRVVGAYEAGAWAEARKWVQRNKSLAASLAVAVVLLVLGLTASLVFKARADERAGNVLKLSAFQTLDDLTKEADALWPAEPRLVEHYRAWMKKAGDLVATLPEFRAALAEIERRASPQSEVERAQERASHPRFRELEGKVAELGWMKRMLGQEPWPNEADVEATLSKVTLPADANGLNTLAWRLVDPDMPVYGSEIEGLLLARRAVAGSSRAERPYIRDSLTWAYFRLGRFGEATAEANQALEEFNPAQREEYRPWVKKLGDAIQSWQVSSSAAEAPGGTVHGDRRNECDVLAHEVSALDAEVSMRRTWRFPEGAIGGESGDRWWHAEMLKLIAAMESFSDEKTGLMHGISDAHGWGVAQRLEFASRIEERTVSSAQATLLWSEAKTAIASSSKYSGLKLLPELGLLPIGSDPESGLWEFAHLQSGAPAVRGANGKLALTEDTGLVFVLVPGGSFWMGAQKSDPSGRNYDPQAIGNEYPPHPVTLSPYFLSKYEMTQGQWERATGRNPSTYTKEKYRSIWNKAGKSGSALHPVEQVSWTNSMEVMAHLGCALPTEAQWEYACRAGTSSVYSTGDSLEGLGEAANIADAYGHGHGGEGWPSWEHDIDDGNVVHADVGSYSPNQYGLHDMHGNVWELCRDGYEYYSAFGRQVDPVVPWSGSIHRVARGGCFRYPGSLARSAHRNSGASENMADDLGLRPAMELRSHSPRLQPEAK